MQFTSVPYLAFLVFSVVVYWLLPVRFRRPFVLLASLAFYATWGAVFVVVPIAVCILVYLIGKRMLADKGNAKHWMWLGVSCALALLAFFKYRTFFLVNVNALLAWFAASPISFAKTIALPVGISFYSFEAIGYLIDIRQGRVKEVKFFDLLLFLLFWPNVTSGPIVRARELVPQLQFRVKFEPRFIFEGLDRVLWGLVQKTVIANLLGMWVDKGFAPSVTAAPSSVDGWFLAIAFGFQIYFDFAGYSNMAIGAARLLGIGIPENFRQPYHAATPADFWARWHMTLSRWIRDYLFFPINAKWKGAPLPLYASLLGIMALVGLWHGAGWNYMIWGLMHGAYLVAYRIYESAKTARPALAESHFAAGAWRLLTLVAVTAAWVFFRASDLHKAAAILSSMFLHFSAGRIYNPAFYMLTVMLMLFCAVEPVLLGKLTVIEEHAGARGPSLFRIFGRPLVYSCALLLFLLFDSNNAQFIYSQF